VKANQEPKGGEDSKGRRINDMKKKSQRTQANTNIVIKNQLHFSCECLMSLPMWKVTTPVVFEQPTHLPRSLNSKCE